MCGSKALITQTESKEAKVIYLIIWHHCIDIVAIIPFDDVQTNAQLYHQPSYSSLFLSVEHGNSKDVPSTPVSISCTHHTFNYYYPKRTRNEFIDFLRLRLAHWTTSSMSSSSSIFVFSLLFFVSNEVLRGGIKLFGNISWNSCESCHDIQSM